MSARTVSFALALALGCAATALGAKDYGLAPQPVAPDTWCVIGRSEHFDPRNGGNIVNTCFLVTQVGVLVIDTGPSRLYGEQLRQAITRVTDRPVVRVYNTHLHPDHCLGNQAFEGLPIHALAGTLDGIRARGDGFADNLYRLLWVWMAGTRVVPPSVTLTPGVEEIGGHRLKHLAFAGHTDADLVILDETTGVLFAGDLVFHGRTPTTPHADPALWLGSLEALGRLPFRVLVPGHGPVAADVAPILQTAGYVRWLTGRLASLAEAGTSQAEALDLAAGPPIPEAIGSLAVFADEYPRSLAHLYPALEAAALSRGRVEWPD